MLADPVARVWAEALFGIARDAGTVEATGEELAGLLKLIRENPDIEQFLSSPVLEPAVKVAHLRRALEGRVSEAVADFLCLLVEKRRTPVLGKIVEAYRAMADERAGRVRVSVRAAAPLGEALRGEIEKVLRERLESAIVLEEQTEPALLGGAVVAIGDTVYDGSVRNRLRGFRKRIMRRGIHEAQG